MERKVNIAKSFEEADKWDIEQQINMTAQQRQKAAKELKKRFYGTNPPDVRSKEGRSAVLVKMGFDKK